MIRFLKSLFQSKDSAAQDLANLRLDHQRQHNIIVGLNYSIGLLTEKLETTRTNSTHLIAAVIATCSKDGAIIIDGNIVDAIVHNPNLRVVVDEQNGDGSRRVRLIEEEDPAEPTDKELDDIEADEFHFMDDDLIDDDDLEDEDEDLCPA